MNIFTDDVIFGHGTQPYAHTTLGDIFESNELFTAYPQLNENGKAIIWNDYLVDTENSKMIILPHVAFVCKDGFKKNI